MNIVKLDPWKEQYEQNVRRRDEAMRMLKTALALVAMLGIWALAHWLGCV